VISLVTLNILQQNPENFFSELIHLPYPAYCRIKKLRWMETTVAEFTVWGSFHRLRCLFRIIFIPHGWPFHQSKSKLVEYLLIRMPLLLAAEQLLKIWEAAFLPVLIIAWKPLRLLELPLVHYMLINDQFERLNNLWKKQIFVWHFRHGDVSQTLAKKGY